MIFIDMRDVPDFEMKEKLQVIKDCSRKFHVNIISLSKVKSI